MTFARDFFFPKKETDSRYNVIPIEVSFCIHGTTKLYGLHIVLDTRDSPCLWVKRQYSHTI